MPPNFESELVAPFDANGLLAHLIEASLAAKEIRFTLDKGALPLDHVATGEHQNDVLGAKLRVGFGIAPLNRVGLPRAKAFDLVSITRAE